MSGSWDGRFCLPLWCPDSQHRQSLPEEKAQASPEQRLLCERIKYLDFFQLLPLFTWSLKSRRTRVKAETFWLAVPLPRTLVGHMVPIVVLMTMRGNPAQPFLHKDRIPYSLPVGLHRWTAFQADPALSPLISR